MLSVSINCNKCKCNSDAYPEIMSSAHFFKSSLYAESDDSDEERKVFRLQGIK